MDSIKTDGFAKRAWAACASSRSSDLSSSFPLTLDLFRLNLVGKYLTYAFVAIGLVMLWGYGGVLSLGQGVFFGLGGYCMAMFLKLEASDPETTKIQSRRAFPTSWTGTSSPQLPLWWEPFRTCRSRSSR
jgi:urea transport system permease protein